MAEICTKCGKTRASPSQNCRECHRLAQKRYRESRPDRIKEIHERHRDVHRDKVNARHAVFYAVKTGKMLPASAQKCEDCGSEAEHLHHESYSPEHLLDVVPLCTTCHGKRHTENTFN